MIKTYVISLSSQSERLKSIDKDCKNFGLSPTYVDAVDLRAKNLEELTNFYIPLPTKRGLKKLTPAEIGCALSHQKIYRDILAKNRDFSLILEDDAKIIGPLNTILKNIETIQKNSHFDVLILGYVKVLEKKLKYYYRRIPLKVLYQFRQFILGKPWEQYSCGTVGYIITCEGAKKLLLESNQKIQVTADNWLHFEKFCNLKVLHLRPSVIIEDTLNFKSTIRTEKDNFLKIKPTSYIIRSLKGIIKNFLMNKLNMK